MSFIVDLYSLSKKENSTKQPTSATSFNCVIKENSGVVNPTIILDIGLSNNPSQYNYAYIPDFNRYYWIKEWVNDRALWIASLEVDVLATYKTEIGNHDLYVLRSANEWDGNVIDTMYPTKIINNRSVTYSVPSRLIPAPSIADGMFVIGVTSQSANFGAIQYYAMNHQAFNRFMNYMLDDATLERFGFNEQNYDCSLALQKALIDPISFIKSCVFIPYPYASYSGAESSTLYIWDWSLDVVNKPITYDAFAVALDTCEITLPKHPQTATRGNYCNVAPYTEYNLVVNPFGEIALDTTKLYNVEKISLIPRLDLTTGECRLNVVGDDNFNHSILYAQIGVPIMLAQVSTDMFGQLTNTVNTVGSIFANTMAGNFAGAITSGVNGIANGIQAIQPRQSSSGEQGGFMKLYQQPMLLSSFYEIVDDDINCHGRPLCKIRKPSNLGGYMLIQDADISISATEYELNKIRAYLEGGFYYE